MPNRAHLSTPLLRRSAIVAAAMLTWSYAGFADGPTDQAFTRDTGDAAVDWGPCPDFMPEGCGLAVLHGDPSSSNADVLFRLAGNTTAERHWHHSAERMVLLSGQLQVSYDGQQPVVMRPGTYAYGPAELPHTATCQSADPCVLFIAFEEPVDALPGEPE